MKEFLNAIQKHDFSEALEKNAQLNIIENSKTNYFIYKNKKHVNLTVVKNFMNLAMLNNVFINIFKVEAEEIVLYKFHRECLSEDEIKKLLNHERVKSNEDFKNGLINLLKAIQ